MKRWLITVCLMAPLVTTAQDFRLGFKAGGNLSWIGTGSDQSEKTTTAGYLIGFEGLFHWDQFGIRPEIQYSRQGGEVAIPGFSYKEEFDYLNFPIAFTFALGKGFDVQGGTYFALLLQATEIVRDGLNESVNNIDDFIADTDYGFLAGIGYNLTNAWAFELRYNYGMTDVSLAGNFERRNRFWQLSATYFFIK